MLKPSTSGTCSRRIRRCFFVAALRHSIDDVDLHNARQHDTRRRKHSHHQELRLRPAALVVKVGTTVTWTNQDGDAHTVTSQNNSGPLSSPPLNTGQTYAYTFTKPGTYSYLCTIHPFMTATVTVTQ